MKPQQLRFTGFFFILSALLVSCKTTSRHPATSNTKGSYNDCSVNGMAQRRADTFERTKSCAVDAIGIGMAETVQTAALAAGEARAIASAIKSFNQIRQTARFNINIAKGTLCAETLLGGLALNEVSKFVTDQMITQGITPDAEFNSLASVAANIATAGGSDAYAALGSFMASPNLEKALAFGSKSSGAFGDFRQLVTTCSEVFTSVLNTNQLNVLQIAKLGKAFGRIGMIGAIANCSAAGLFNTIDVGTEVNCLVQDLRYLEEQNKKILASERNLCEELADIAALPTSRPAILGIRNDIDPENGKWDAATENRARLCYQVISRWGRCLASHPVALRSEGYCNKLCTRASISTTEDMHRIAATTGYPEPREIIGLIDNAVEHCTSAGNPEALVRNGNKPCVNLCMQGTGGLNGDTAPDYPAGF